MKIPKASKYLLIIVLLSSCSEKGIDRYSWLIGDWKGNYQEIQYFENWRKTSEDRLSGDSYVVQNGDTVFREKNIIELVNGAPIFSLSYPDSKEPIILKISTDEAGKLVFESKEHDYPQTLTYEMTGDSLHVITTGIHEKQKVKEEAYFRKK